MSYPDTLTRLESQVAQLQDARMQEARERDWLRSEVKEWRKIAYERQAEVEFLQRLILMATR